MDSTFYQFQLGLLAVICTVFLALERYLKSKKTTPVNLKELSVEENLEVGHSTLSSNGAALPAVTPRAGALSTLMRKYILVYAIVMGADWLQGPYVYSLYREQYAFPERQVAVLFVTGFMSAAVFAPFLLCAADASGFVYYFASYMQRRAAFSSSRSSLCFFWHASLAEYRRPYCFLHSRVGSYPQAQAPRCIVKT